MRRPFILWHWFIDIERDGNISARRVDSRRHRAPLGSETKPSRPATLYLNVICHWYLAPHCHCYWQNCLSAGRRDKELSHFKFFANKLNVLAFSEVTSKWRTTGTWGFPSAHFGLWEVKTGVELIFGPIFLSPLLGINWMKGEMRRWTVNIQ